MPANTNSEAALGSAEWILRHDFKDYNATEPVYNDRGLPDRYHYGAVIYAQAMFQLGGKYWKQFFPPLVDTCWQTNSLMAHGLPSNRTGNTEAVIRPPW